MIKYTKFIYYFYLYLSTKTFIEDYSGNDHQSNTIHNKENGTIELFLLEEQLPNK